MRIFACSLACLSLALTGCSDPKSADDDDDDVIDSGPIVLFDAAPPDAAPPPDAEPEIDAALYAKGPTVGVDSIALVGQSNAFQSMAPLVNGTLQTQVDSGSLLWAFELRNLDDPSGQADDSIELGFYSCVDPDGDSSNNYVPESPDRWVTAAGSEDISGNPVVSFTGAITNGFMSVDGGDVISVPTGLFPLDLHEPTIQGFLEPSPENDAVYHLAAGEIEGEATPARLQGTLPIATLGGLPNLASSFGCPGADMLDLLIFGCQITGFSLSSEQPDGDLDGDGLETLCDTCDDAACAERIGGSPGEVDAMAGDGIISCCIDGDGTVTTGAGCEVSPAFADGWVVQLDLHGTRILLMSETQPTE